MKPEFIFPDWPAPRNIKSAVTTRIGGVSQSPYGGFNIASHVEDEPESVRQNRQLLKEVLALPAEPVWLEQVHGVRVIDAAIETDHRADASYTGNNKVVCSVMTADCLPVLFCNRAGSKVAAAHAGWRGLAEGVLEATIDALAEQNENILAWLGPAIGPEVFEISDEVRDIFLRNNVQAESAFRASKPGHWLADLYELARQRLATKGVTQVFGGGECTYSDSVRFYSYRRDGKTGRMASLIWIE
ncbi:MAG: peptidoglycan editing factor PgeF [Gammaproteobacteria bacterium]|nr:peptidoglycan editing factor PgeF [Gammaproteobacteria bacterium]MDH5613586.1 peptidoglycan editing factor PgeF [Gammaproteobacteria bacterium]